MAGGPATLDAAPGEVSVRADIFLLNPDHTNHTATGLAGGESPFELGGVSAGVNDVTCSMYTFQSRGITCRVWV